MNDSPYSPAFSVESFQRLRNLITGYCGIYFDDDSAYRLEKRLRRRIEALQLSSFDEYYSLLETELRRPTLAREVNALITELTNSETYFFREARQLTLFVGDVLPEIVRHRDPREGVNIWVAGTATGEEAWSLAVLIRDAGVIDPHRVMIHACDLNPQNIAHARRGVYAEKAFRGPALGLRQDVLRARYFARQPDGSWSAREPLRAMVNFFQMNLLDASRLGLLTRMDAIFCRNVIIYFHRDRRRQVIETFYEKLRPGGFLFLGHSESLLQQKHGFHLRHFGDDDLVYQRPPLPEAPR